MSTFTKAHDCPHKDLDICMLTLNMPVFDNGFFFDSFDSKSIFLNEQEKKAKKSYHAAIKPCLAHICTKRSHKCGMSSIQNSFHTGVNSLFSSQRFVLARSLYFRLNFMCPNVCWCFLGEEVGKKPRIHHTWVNLLITKTCKCLPHENEMFSSINVFCFLPV